MKNNEFYLHISSLEFLNEKNKQWNGIWSKLYQKLTLYKRKQKIKALLSELLERRERIDNLICAVQYLETLVNGREHSVDNPSEGNSNTEEAIYRDIVDKMLNYISKDISFFIFDIADTAIEVNEEVHPDDIYGFFNYKISTGVKDYFDYQEGEEQSSLKKMNYDYYLYFCDEKSISNRIYYQFIIEQYNKLYSEVLDKQKIDLELLLRNDSEKTQSEIFSQLFRSILSKYVFTWRTKNHITQNELAKRSGVDRTMIAKIESLQQTASLDTTIKLLNTMDAHLMIVSQQ